MGLDLVPSQLLDRYVIDERWHACAILASDFPAEFNDLIDCLTQFELVRSEIAAAGGGKSKIVARFDDLLVQRGWRPKSTQITMAVDGAPRTLETHEIDLWKNRVALEVEWNNKDTFFARDLNAFRLLHDLGVVSAGVIVTRADELQSLFNNLGWTWDAKQRHWTMIGGKYGASTTHWSKLISRVTSGGGGTCPLLLVGITEKCYRDDTPNAPAIMSKPTTPP